MKKNPLFWLPAFVGLLLSTALIVIVLSSSSKEYQKYTEKPKISEAKKAIDLAYNTRQERDIIKAQIYVNALNKEDQKVYSDKISEIEQGVNKLNKINESLYRLKNNITEQNLKAFKNVINALNNSCFKKDKKKYLNIFSDFEKKYEDRFKGKKLIALTFDDGPNPTTTPQLLEILESKKVPVTFFALGENAQKYPDIIKQEAKNGHEVASHTWDHKDLQRLSVEEQKKEILNANQLINKITGQDISLYRPPYGSYNDNILKVTPLTIVNWSVDTNDWRYNTSEPVIENALNYAYDGSIILMHDIHSWSVEAVPQIIDDLHKQGYTFVTVSTLIEIHSGKITPQTAYFE